MWTGGVMVPPYGLARRIEMAALEEEMVQSKNLWGLAVACIGLFMAIFFSITIRYLLNTDEISEK